MKYIKHIFEHINDDINDVNIEILQVLTSALPILEKKVFELIKEIGLKPHHTSEMHLGYDTGDGGRFSEKDGKFEFTWNFKEYKSKDVQDDLYKTGFINMSIAIKLSKYDENLDDYIEKLKKNITKHKFEFLHTNSESAYTYIMVEYKVSNILDMGYNVMKQINQ